MNIDQLTEILVSEDEKISDLIKLLEKTGLGVILVADTHNRLIGTVTDGDVRRAMLRKISFDQPCGKICNKDPLYVQQDYLPDQVRRLFDHNPKKCTLSHIPVVDNNKRVIDLLLPGDFISESRKENIVFIMAGGLGTRLSPLTDVCPKPLVKISEKPIIEILLENFIDEGFSDFYISVNYKGQMIEDYIGNGDRWGVNIQYIYEEKRLGTAGPLSLLPIEPDRSIFVVNADILTKVSFQKLLEFHDNTQSDATLCVREYEYEVPYGVVQISNHQVVDIEEKPVQNFYVNIGIYVLSPSVLNSVPKDTYFDMTELLKDLMQSSKLITSYPVHEYWLDVGRVEDLERAHKEYRLIFQ